MLSDLDVCVQRFVSVLVRLSGVVELASGLFKSIIVHQGIEVTGDMTIDPRPAKRGRKYHQALRGARKVFLAVGYEGASVDEIAREADVSKATLYSYFPDKRSMFLEFAGEELRLIADRAANDIDLTAPVRDVMMQAGKEIQNFYLSEFGQNIFRICAAEAARFPELGRRFFEQGMRSGHRLLSIYLSSAAERGELSIAEEEVDLAAFQFADLCRTGLFNRMLFIPAEPATNDERNRTLEAAVDTFMARYGVAS